MDDLATVKLAGRLLFCMGGLLLAAIAERSLFGVQLPARGRENPWCALGGIHLGHSGIAGRLASLVVINFARIYGDMAGY